MLLLGVGTMAPRISRARSTDKGKGKRAREEHAQEPAMEYPRFVNKKAEELFEGFVKRKFTIERGFDLGAPENAGILAVVERRAWRTWCTTPHTMIFQTLVAEFYANLSATQPKYHSAKTVKVRGRTVHIAPRDINNYLQINPEIGNPPKDSGFDWMTTWICGWVVPWTHSKDDPEWKIHFASSFLKPKMKV